MCCVYFTCSALVQPVESDDVHLAYLSGGAELDTGVRDGHQGGLVVLRESVPEATIIQTIIRVAC